MYQRCECKVNRRFLGEKGIKASEGGTHGWESKSGEREAMCSGRGQMIGIVVLGLV